MASDLRKRQWQSTVVYLLWFISALWFLHTSMTPPQPREVSYDEFMSELKAGHLVDVSITERQLVGDLKKDLLKNKKPPENPQIECSRIPGLEAGPLVQELEALKVKFSGSIPAPSWWAGLLISWGPMLLLFGIYFVAMWRMQKGGGPLSLGRNRAKVHDQSSQLDTKFSDVAGVEEAKNELVEIIDFLKPRGTPKTDHRGSLQNRPTITIIQDVDYPRVATLGRCEQCLERREETASYRIGTARLVNSEDRGSHWSPPSNRR